VSSVKW